MTCCGQERATRFCSDCGKQLWKNLGLVGLLLHCRQNESKFLTQAKTVGLDGKELHPKVFERRVRAAEEWKAWADELEQLMQGLPHADRS